MKITDHFDSDEFACKDGTPVPDALVPNLRRLCANLEALRLDARAPVVIMSGYRTRSYNRKVCGARASRHCIALAADVQVAGMAPDALADRVEALVKAGRMEPGGVGRYESFTHYDCRGTNARWDSRQSGRRG